MFPKTCGFDRLFDTVKDRSMLTEDRLNALYNVGLYCSNLEGDFAELGCHAGGTSLLLSSIVKSPNRMHSFDSFEGLSAPTVQDFVNEKVYVHKGESKSNYESVREYLPETVKLYKGWIEDTIQLVEDRKFSLVHIDMDLYEPTKLAMRFIWKRMVRGGYIVFDDYRWGTTPGIAKAVDEFFVDIMKHQHYYIYPQLGIMK